MTGHSLGHSAVTGEGRRRAAPWPERATGTSRLPGGDVTQQVAIRLLQSLHSAALHGVPPGSVTWPRLWSAGEHQHSDDGDNSQL